MLRIFLHRKNPTASAGFEPANSGIRGQNASPLERYTSVLDICVNIYGFGLAFTFLASLFLGKIIKTTVIFFSSF
jgi:hypothetical protein